MKTNVDQVVSKLVVKVAERRITAPTWESRASARTARKERGENQAIVARVLARETPFEKRERALRCLHGKCHSLCEKCAGLTGCEIQKWNKHRTKGRHVNRDRGTLNRYVPVRISRADCDLVPRGDNYDWYLCLDCDRQIEIAHSKKELTHCPTCKGTVARMPEPFQRYQFSLEIGTGAPSNDYDDDNERAVRNVLRSEEAFVAADLFADSNSRFQKGGTGYLRIPLDAPRSTRADAPEWIRVRESFLRTLRPTRAARGEKILSEFYLEGKTDAQIAEIVGWTKDAVKKERRSLIKDGDEFFRPRPAGYPPSPAIGEGDKHHEKSDPLCQNHPPSSAMSGDATPAIPLQEARPVSPAESVAVCSPDPTVLYLYPVFDSNGERFAKMDGHFVRVADLNGFLREEAIAARNREHLENDEPDELTD